MVDGIKSIKGEKVIIKKVKSFTGLRSFYLEKKQVFLPGFLCFLLDIGFDKNSSDLAYYFGAPGEGIKYEDDGLDQSYFNDPFSGVYKDINDFKQENYGEDGIRGEKAIGAIKSGGFLYFINKEYDIELVFFSNFILLNIRTSNKNLVKSANALSKFCEFPNTELNPRVIDLE